MPDTACTQCRGTGWKTAPDGKSVVRCGCRPVRDVSDDFELSSLRESERRVYQLLERHSGAQNAILQADIAYRLGMSRREVGATIQSLVIDHGAPIGASCGKRSGYFLIETEEERRKAERNLRSRIEWLMARLHALSPSRCREFLNKLLDGR